MKVNEKQLVMPFVSVFVCGLLFGLGLTISGMTNPAKIIGFLDVAGDWDPSLILVMASGLALSLVCFRFVLKIDRPLFEAKFYLPTKTDIDLKLILGAILFGVGWGLAGFCPGPAIAALVSLNSTVLLFLAAMIGGMYLHRFVGPA